MRVLYLHGFASGPRSRKASLFIENLGREGIRCEALDLAPDFEHSNISSELAVMQKAIDGEPAVLIGSSLGGYLGALYASKHPEIKRLVLLAPAFDFYQLWVNDLGQSALAGSSNSKLEEWRKTGSANIFHYGSGREVPLSYQFLADAAGYPAYPDFQQPCLILHGRLDTVVSLENSRHFAAGRPNATLVALESGHELTDVLDEIWKRSWEFLHQTITNGHSGTY